MNEDTNREKVLSAVKELGRASIKKIAKTGGMSSPTASKYLYSLEIEGIIEIEEVKPYKFFKMKEEIYEKKNVKKEK